MFHNQCNIKWITFIESDFQPGMLKLNSIWKNTITKPLRKDKDVNCNWVVDKLIDESSKIKNKLPTNQEEMSAVN